MKSISLPYIRDITVVKTTAFLGNPWNFRDYLGRLLFNVLARDQGCPQDVKSQDRDETETVNLQDRDETFQKRLETASRPRRSRQLNDNVMYM